MFSRGSVGLVRWISSGLPLRAGGHQRRSHINYEKYIMKRKSIRQEVKKKSVTLWHSMNTNQLAEVLEIPPASLFDLILDIPGSDTLQDEETPILDSEIFAELAKKLHFKAKFVASPTISEAKEENMDLFAQPEDPLESKPRSPIVTILGHVDHGKTTLLDHLRQSSVTETEFGGITQHIGAFSVPVPSFVGNKITFIDTPGHAAFKSMRNRGVCATDIAVLVVDACEGVLEQTVESLRMIRDLGRPYIVAINKIDKPQANVEETKKHLQELGGVKLEDFGGDVQSIPISALKGTNIEGLLNSIGALAEVLELRGDPTGQVRGVVLESNVEKGVGRSTVFLVQKGTLKKGDVLVGGSHYGKVRTIRNEAGKSLNKAEPSEVVRISGWKSLPSAGDEVLQAPSEKKALEVVKYRDHIRMSERALADNIHIEKRRSLERDAYKQNRSETLKSGRIKSKRNYLQHIYATPKGIPKLSIVIKADVHGSLEAILDCLSTYDAHEDVKLDIVDFGVGEVTENDVSLAQENEGIVYAFNAPLSKSITSSLSMDRIKTCNVIYALMHDVRDEINDRMPLMDVEMEEGVAVLLKEFTVTHDKKKVRVAGCKVLSGKISRGSAYRIKRGQSVILENIKLKSLKHLREEVTEIPSGMECGLIFEDANIQFLPSDRIESYSLVQERKTTIWNGGL